MRRVVINHLTTVISVLVLILILVGFRWFGIWTTLADCDINKGKCAPPSLMIDLFQKVSKFQYSTTVIGVKVVGVSVTCRGPWAGPTS